MTIFGFMCYLPILILVFLISFFKKLKVLVQCDSLSISLHCHCREPNNLAVLQNCILKIKCCIYVPELKINVYSIKFWTRFRFFYPNFAWKNKVETCSELSENIWFVICERICEWIGCFCTLKTGSKSDTSFGCSAWLWFVTYASDSKCF